MLQRDGGPINLFGFLVGVEIEEGGSTTPEQVTMRLADGLSWMEGIGKVEVENLGKIEVVDETQNHQTKAV